MLGAKELGIAWGDNPQHWYWERYLGSRFAKVPELQWVCWLEIRGKLETRLLSPKTLNAAYLVLKFNEPVVYGFEFQPIKAKVEVVGRAGGNSSVCSEERCIYLSPNGGRGQHFASLALKREDEILGVKDEILAQKTDSEAESDEDEEEGSDEEEECDEEEESDGEEECDEEE
ncbi:F-box protein PP2-B10-like [Papaver somniferum]|uniref:F-box protein PP2-B10-like n=1 Tax=Papaver somniferum TaxID=3469 RepID=UPI000E701487|nr:F-box protein PP2-B10-like [Papaver somniferum]